MFHDHILWKSRIIRVFTIFLKKIVKVSKETSLEARNNVQVNVEKLSMITKTYIFLPLLLTLIGPHMSI